MNDVSKQTLRRIRMTFPPSETKMIAMLLLQDCGKFLPGVPEDADPDFFERLHCAALKLSKGQMEKMYDALYLANTDWRDLLVKAGFGDDPNAHKNWVPGDQKPEDEEPDPTKTAENPDTN